MQKLMVQLPKKAIKYALLYSQLYKFIAHKSHNPSTSLRILSFHKIYQHWDPFFPGLSIVQFKQQLLHLKKNYRIMKLAQALDILAKGEEFDQPTLCVTFDDGFQCVYENAYPLLEKLNIPATIFLTAGFVGSHATIWPDLVSGLIKCTKRRDIVANGKRFFLSDKEQKLLALREIKSFLKTMGKEERDNVISNLIKILQDDYELEYPFLTWEHIGAMDDELIDFGSHTVTHPILSKVSRDEQNNEIANSKKLLEKHLQRSIDMFAYPNGLEGDYNNATLELLCENGFKYAFLNYGGVCRGIKKRFEIPRISEVHSNIVDFSLAVAGILKW